MSKSEFPNVQIGQVWADNDKRCQGRTVRIIGIDPENIVGERRALVRVESDSTFRVMNTVGKTKRILLRRFKPTSTGYRLVQDVGE